MLKLIVLVLVVTSCHSSRQPVQSNASNNLSIPAADSISDSDTSFRDGTDFLGSGTEPFWSVSIDFTKTMHFKMADGYELTVPASSGTKAMDADVTRYRSATDQGTLTVQIAHFACVNEMSGKKSEYTVSVDLQKKDSSTAAFYKGCGHYVSDYRIHDIWVLKSINDSALNGKDFAKGLPLLEINLKAHRVMGHTGCNTLKGSLEVKGKMIRFPQIITTRMTCNQSSFERIYLQDLNQKEIAYRFDSGKLFLQINPNRILQYQKVD